MQVIPASSGITPSPLVTHIFVPERQHSRDKHYYCNCDEILEHVDSQLLNSMPLAKAVKVHKGQVLAILDLLAIFIFFHDM